MSVVWVSVWSKPTPVNRPQTWVMVSPWSFACKRLAGVPLQVFQLVQRWLGEPSGTVIACRVSGDVSSVEAISFPPLIS